MGKKSKLELNREGVKDLLKSSGIRSNLFAVAGGIASEAGNCKIKASSYPERARVGVRQSATSKDLEENTLLKAVHFI
jgi:hypothetical protein